MAERNLRDAADLASRHPDEAAALGVDDEEIAAWRDAAAAMHVPYDERRGVHPQDAGFLDHAVPDFRRATSTRCCCTYPYFQLYRQQVVKQADLVMAIMSRGDRFTPEQKARNFAYYEAITVRDSSLSACVQAVVAAEVGHLELAYDYFGEAALMDLADLEHNTRDGLHMASLAGAWIAAVAGFGGMRDSRRGLTFRPGSRRRSRGCASGSSGGAAGCASRCAHDEVDVRAARRRAARRLPRRRARADRGRRAADAPLDGARGRRPSRPSRRAARPRGADRASYPSACRPSMLTAFFSA